jgi:2,3-bisphosphoglycerate-dependent phosphoglycerate mutase
VSQLILLRHGQSSWNKANLFTGWVDIPLSMQGVDEAFRAGEKISNIPIDIIFCSTLVRSQQTAFLAMLKHHSGKIPVVIHTGEGRQEEWAQMYSEAAKEETIPVLRAWQLNERYYGELQGLNKDETRQKYGAEQVQIWRRSYDVPPPNGESLEMTTQRAIPYFEKTILPMLQSEQNVLISAHGNSLRAIIMYLDGLSKEEVVALELATGDPIVYTYSNGKLKK